MTPRHAGRESRDELLLWTTFEAAARSHADSEAFVDSSASISYGRLLERALDAADRLRAALGAGGSSPEGRPPVIALVDGDPLATLRWTLGALHIGAAIAPIAPTDRDRATELLCPDLTVEWTDHATPRVERHPPGRPRALPPGIVVCTAGTTGRPKAVVHSHTTLAHAVRRLQLVRLESAGTNCRVPADNRELADDLLDAAVAPALGLRYATTLPLTTMAGLTVALQALLAGDAVVVPATADASQLLDTIVALGVTNVSLTPGLAQIVTRAASRQPRALDRLFFVGIGGGPVARERAEALEAAIGCPVAVGYGTTEAGGALAMGRIADPAEVRHGTVGRPLPGVDVSIDPHSRELTVRCASTAVGYLSDVGRLIELERGNVPTKDLARLRPDGAIELCGRADAIIIRGGRNIDPVRIERVLEDHPAVRRAAAFGVPNRVVAGEQDIWGVVVLDHTVEERELRAYCNRTLGASLTPRRVIPVELLPLTLDGAVRRDDLARLASESAVRTRR